MFFSKQNFYKKEGIFLKLQKKIGLIFLLAIMILPFIIAFTSCKEDDLADDRILYGRIYKSEKFENISQKYIPYLTILIVKFNDDNTLDFMRYDEDGNIIKSFDDNPFSFTMKDNIITIKPHRPEIEIEYTMKYNPKKDMLAFKINDDIIKDGTVYFARVDEKEISDGLKMFNQ